MEREKEKWKIVLFGTYILLWYTPKEVARIDTKFKEIVETCTGKR
jgi:hypothetical protein